MKQKVIELSESCDEHSCADCIIFNWDRFNQSDAECPCYDCSHGWKRDIVGSKCKYVKEINSYLIESNKRFIAKSKHVLDMLK
jgi:hypothetical protein